MTTLGGEKSGDSCVDSAATPDSKVPIAIVGLNFGRYIIETQLLRGIGSPYFQLSGICDLDCLRVAEMSAALGVTAYTDFDELLTNPTISAIGLFTGPSGRADLIRKAIRAGKHVITTKPFELDPEAALSVLREARKLGRSVHINSPAPTPSPDISQITAWRAQYDLGKIVGCRADVWASYAEKADGTWLDDPKKCPVAPIFRLGIYLINDLIALFGEAEEVHVFASRLSTGRPTPDTAQLGISFKNGGLASIFSSFCVNDGDHYRNSLVLNFQNGTVYRNVGPDRGTDADNASSELTLIICKNGKRVIAEQAQLGASGHYRWDLFHRANRGERIEGEITPEQIVEGLKIVQAMAKAHETSRSVRVT